MMDKEKLHQILSSLWKNDKSVGKTYYNQALQDVQIAIDSLQEEPKTDWLQELQEKLDSLSKEDFKKVWAKYKLREEGSVDYDKLNTMLDESLSKETKESWNKRLGEEPVSDDLEAFVNSTYPDRKVVLGRGNTCLSCGRVQREACITGANWQKKKDFQDESDMAVVAYMDGVEKGKKMMRDQIMKDAVDGTVFAKLENGEIMVRSNYFMPEDLSYQDKVKLIISKEE